MELGKRKDLTKYLNKFFNKKDYSKEDVKKEAEIYYDIHNLYPSNKAGKCEINNFITSWGAVDAYLKNNYGISLSKLIQPEKKKYEASEIKKIKNECFLMGLSGEPFNTGNKKKELTKYASMSTIYNNCKRNNRGSNETHHRKFQNANTMGLDIRNKIATSLLDKTNLVLTKPEKTMLCNKLKLDPKISHVLNVSI